jgi:hypothetical protein
VQVVDHHEDGCLRRQAGQQVGDRGRDRLQVELLRLAPAKPGAGRLPVTEQRHQHLDIHRYQVRRDPGQPDGKPP